MTDRTIRVILYGLGPIGLSVAKLALTKVTLQVVGAVDIDPAKVGHDLGELLGRTEPLGVVVTDDVPRLLERTQPDLALLTTLSAIPAVTPQIDGLVKAGVNVISSSEQLFFPLGDGAAAAAPLDELARTHGVSILGTGVNPGFVMDFLPLTLTSVCQEVDRIRVTRRVDVATRRLPLQRVTPFRSAAP